jgi:hypothetical protein
VLCILLFAPWYLRNGVNSNVGPLIGSSITTSCDKESSFSNVSYHCIQSSSVIKETFYIVFTCNNSQIWNTHEYFNMHSHMESYASRTNKTSTLYN